LRGREEAFVDKPLAKVYAVVEIDFPDGYCATPGWRAPYKDGTVPTRLPFIY
jgi:hypothetical protein